MNTMFPFGFTFILKNSLFSTESTINLLTMYEEYINEKSNELDMLISKADKISSFLFIEKNGILKNSTFNNNSIVITKNICGLEINSKTILTMFHVKQITDHNPIRLI